MEFFDKYSYKQKNYVLALLAVLIAAVVYKHKISILLETKELKRELEEKIQLAATADNEIRSTQIEIAQLNRFLGEENNSIEKVQQGFLNFFAKKATKISVYQVNEVLGYQHPDFTINTHLVVLKGDYLHTLRFIYDLEKEFRLAKILNCTFEYKKSSSDDEKSLYTTLLIQNYLK